MSARVLDGRAIAAEVLSVVSERVSVLRGRGIAPQLCFVTIGHSAPAQMYAKRLEKQAARAGIVVTRRELAEDVSLSELDRTVAALNDSPEVDGILVQMPLPEHLTAAELAVIVHPRKDVDGITTENAGRLYLGLPGPVPSTALAMMQIVRHADIPLDGRHAVIVGRSNVVGHPVAELLVECDATVTITHRRTRDLAAMTRQADLLIVGAGSPHLITAEMIQPGVAIIDAGINATPEGTVGDVDFAGCAPIASAITPVPGGVGPVTNIVLLRNVVDSAERRLA